MLPATLDIARVAHLARVVQSPPDDALGMDTSPEALREVTADLARSLSSGGGRRRLARTLGRKVSA